MGLTHQSTGMCILVNELKIQHTSPHEKIIALAGNPNVGKSTVFNYLTGMKQHTGNWPGKTVTSAYGKCRHKDRDFILVDLPGTYSLMAKSAEEEVARDFICFGKPDATVVVTDATCLERNLNLVLQILEITKNVVVCVNLMDEAKRKKINIDLEKLSKILGVPVVGTNAKSGDGLNELMEAVYTLTNTDSGKNITDTININNTSQEENSSNHSLSEAEYSDLIEEAVNMLKPNIPADLPVQANLPARWLSLRLIEDDTSLLNAIKKYVGLDLSENKAFMDQVKTAREFLYKNGIDHDQLKDAIVSSLVRQAEEICIDTVKFRDNDYNRIDRKIDKIVTSKLFGIPLILGLLGIVFWITIVGANYPSELLSSLFFKFEKVFSSAIVYTGAPQWLHDMLVNGMYRTVAWVVSVMLPPMAIFFPLFTLLEDLGYLPRVAFNLDNLFKKACAHGKQALTMCMGFGCNAAGVIGCRIIDSPRERLIATITNNFTPCNGRFPTLIAIISMFIGYSVSGPLGNMVSALSLLGVVALGIGVTLLVSKILSITILKGIPSSFILELPPYRKPQIGRVIVRSIFDRTLFVLGRAVGVAMPAGIILWCIANLRIGQHSLLYYCANFLEPFAFLIGLDGYILLAFILGLPANEIVMPIIIMGYMGAGSLLEPGSLNELRSLLIANNWTWVTAICTMLFSLMHFPCGTTCWTIARETQSIKWTLVSILVPTLTGIIACFIVANIGRLFTLLFTALP